MKVIKFLDEHLEEAVLAILLVGITGIMFLQVIMRFIFHNAIGWAEEISVQLYIISVFFTIGYCIRNQSLLRVEIVESLMPLPVRRILQIVSESVNVLVFGYLFYGSIGTIQTVHKSQAKLAATQLPQYCFYYIYAASLLLGTFRAVEILVKKIQNMERNHEERGNL